jgi:hypothetical protein
LCAHAQIGISGAKGIFGHYPSEESPVRAIHVSARFRPDDVLGKLGPGIGKLVVDVEVCLERLAVNDPDKIAVVRPPARAVPRRSADDHNVRFHWRTISKDSKR